MTETLQTMVSFFTKGGLFMWPLLACSIVTVTTIVLSILTLREKKVLPLVIESEIERLVPGGSAERLMRIVNDDNSSLARITRAALQHMRWPRSENIEFAQTRARAELVRLERGLIVLEVVTGIAPLIGLIGTVSGLVQVFSGLGLSTGAADTKAVALGISMALNCTIFGLSIAVPSLIAFSYFSKKVEVLSVQMESIVSDLIAKCYYGANRQRRGPAAALNRAGERPTRVNAPPRSCCHEDRSPEKAGAFHHHRFARRYPDDSPHLFCRLDHFQKRSAGSSDQSSRIEDGGQCDG